MKKLLCLVLLTAIMNASAFSGKVYECSITNDVNPEQKAVARFALQELIDEEYVESEGYAVNGDVALSFTMSFEFDEVYVTVDYTKNFSGDELDSFEVDEDLLAGKRSEDLLWWNDVIATFSCKRVDTN